MQEKAIKATLEKEPEKKEQESTSEKEEKPKIVINKKIVIKCNDINDLKESFDLVKSNDNYINNILKIQPFTAPEILKKRMDELALEIIEWKIKNWGTVYVDKKWNALTFEEKF